MVFEPAGVLEAIDLGDSPWQAKSDTHSATSEKACLL